MKLLPFLCCLFMFLAPWTGLGQARLTGLVSTFGEAPKAWLVVKEEGGREPFAELRVGDSDLGVVLAGIDLENQIASIQYRRDRRTDQPRLKQSEGVKPTTLEAKKAGQIQFCIQEMPADQLLEVYSRLAKRTLLRRDKLLPFVASMSMPEPMMVEESLVLLNAKFAENGLTIVPHGDQFALVVPVKERERYSRKLPGPGDAVPARGEEVAPLNFAGMPVDQFLGLYTKFLGKTNTNPNQPMPDLSCSLMAVKLMSKREAIYTMTAWLALNDIKVEAVGESEVRLRPFYANAWEEFVEVKR